jgi:hypothetical protein
MVLPHELFRENFGAFELGGFAVGAENAKFTFEEIIDHSQRKRLFGANDSQVDLVPLGEFNQCAGSIGLNIHAFGKLRDAAIAGGAKDLVHFSGLLEFPDKGMFTTAGANHQYIHMLFPNP